MVADAKAQEKHKKDNNRLLFVCKKRLTSGGMAYPGGLSSGLANSVKFVADMLNENHIKAKVVEVHDGNNIDREIYIYRPTHCIVEAIWATPAKLKELKAKWPSVVFIVRIHSEIPFLSTEGVSIEWIYDYQKEGIIVGFNSHRTNLDFNRLDTTDGCLYMPNYYPVTTQPVRKDQEPHIINVGCFGAIRPFKNQLIQAVAAVQYADDTFRKCRFHINTGRIEGNGGPILKNIRAFFANNPKHELVEIDWLPHKEFIKVVKTMDVGMQVSLTETFNIVSADFINCNVPIIGTDEIEFLHPFFRVKPTDVLDMVSGLKTAINGKKFGLQYLNKRLLKKQSAEAENVWVKYFK
jgi:hypothetical protein